MKLLAVTIRIFLKVEKEIFVQADPNVKSFYQGTGFITFDQAESFPNLTFIQAKKRPFRLEMA